ncbi:MAG: hypothetical protein Fur0021_26180 [Candidatus Promineifilaceae bacterium]
MIKYRRIINAETGQTLVARARWCDTFATKLRGFTFRRHLPPDFGLVLVEKADSRLGSSIHMLFVFLPLGVVWVNDAGIVVDTTLAKPWRLTYVPRAAARYVIEASPAILELARPGDPLSFVDVV